MVQPTHFLRAGIAVVAVLTGPHALAQATAVPESRTPAIQAARAAADAVVDPASAVPAVLYRSAFTETPGGVETTEVEW